VRVRGRSALRADIWINAGKLLGLTFSEQPDKWADGDWQIAEVTVWEDPQNCGVLVEHPNMDNVRAWAGTLTVVDEASGPLPTEVREQRLKALGLPVPLDWRALLASSDGLRFGDIRVHGLRDARTVVLDDDELVVLVESDASRLLVLSYRHNDGRVYAYDLEKHELKDAGESLREAIREHMIPRVADR
jgi:hypothetical protein